MVAELFQKNFMFASHLAGQLYEGWQKVDICDRSKVVASRSGDGWVRRKGCGGVVGGSIMHASILQVPAMSCRGGVLSEGDAPIAAIL